MTREDIAAIKLLVQHLVTEEVKSQIPTIKKLLIAEMRASKGQVKQPAPQQQKSNKAPLFKNNSLLNEIFSSVDLSPESERPVQSKAEKGILNKNYGEMLKKMNGNTNQSTAPVRQQSKPVTPKFNINEMVEPLSDEEAAFNWEDEV